jgi:hypothetical protein
LRAAKKEAKSYEDILRYLQMFGARLCEACYYVFPFFIKSLFSFPRCSETARAYSPTDGALWLRIQTILNRANVHTKGTAL